MTELGKDPGLQMKLVPVWVVSRAVADGGSVLEQVTGRGQTDPTEPSAAKPPTALTGQNGGTYFACL